MKIILTAVDDSLAKAWELFCGDLSFVEVYKGSILDLEVDAAVSPANSFGFMDGGIDALYLRRFGRDLEDRVRTKVASAHHGEILVGAADIVETGDDRIPYLIFAPTMRVPMILRDTVNVYLAARAIFLLHKHALLDSGLPVREVISTIAFPGLGTGVGRVSPATCANQVRKAINDVLLDEFIPPRTWAEASERHQLLYTDKLQRLQHDG